LKNSIGDDEGGEINIKVGFHTPKETGGEKMVSDQPQKSGAQIGNTDDDGGRKDAVTFPIQKFLGLGNYSVDH